MSKKKIVKINQGSVKTFSISLRYPSGDPFILTDMTEVIVSLPLNDPDHPDTPSQPFKFSLGEISVISALGGTLQVTCSGTKTTHLNDGEDQSGECLVVLSGDTANPTIVDLDCAFNIKKRLFT